jgi:hypothetical protein
MRDRRKRALSAGEERVDRVLAEYAAEFGYRINLKMRLRDAIDLDDVDLDGRRRNFLWTAHLDFVAIDTGSNLPELAIEYDDATHDDPVQQRRDGIKDELCAESGLPLLRVDSLFARREGRWTVMSYILRAHELGKAFYAAQDRGSIPTDEPFYHGSVIDPDGGFMGLDRAAISFLHKFRSRYSPLWLGQWWRATGRKIEVVDLIALAEGLFLKSECSIANFAIEGISALEIAQELSTAELGWIARRFDRGEGVALGRAEGDRLVADLRSWHFASGWGRPKGGDSSRN